MLLYYWRLVDDGEPTSWWEIDKDKFEQMLKVDFFGKRPSGVHHQGRILHVENIELFGG